MIAAATELGWGCSALEAAAGKLIGVLLGKGDPIVLEAFNCLQKLIANHCPAPATTCQQCIHHLWVFVYLLFRCFKGSAPLM
ncbi:hypothetical protein AAF134_06635 [Synechococcus lacustris Tous-12m]